MHSREPSKSSTFLWRKDDFLYLTAMRMRRQKKSVWALTVEEMAIEATNHTFHAVPVTMRDVGSIVGDVLVG